MFYEKKMNKKYIQLQKTSIRIKEISLKQFGKSEVNQFKAWMMLGITK